MSSSPIYYLYNLAKMCGYIAQKGDKVVDMFVAYVNLLLNKYFTSFEQKQLKLHNFNRQLLDDIAWANMPEGISFNNLNEESLAQFFNQVYIQDVDDLVDAYLQLKKDMLR